MPSAVPMVVQPEEVERHKSQAGLPFFNLFEFNPIQYALRGYQDYQRAMVQAFFKTLDSRYKHQDVSSFAFNQLEVGMKAADRREITEWERDLAAELSGDRNPVHFDESYAAQTMFKRPIAHGHTVQGIFSYLLGMKLPGKGTIYVENNGKFIKPVYYGDTLDSVVEITSIDKERRMLELHGNSKKKTGDKESIVYHHYAKVMLAPSQG